MKASPNARQPKSLADYLALTLATGFGSGYAPVAPGTFGSLVGLAFYFGVAAFHLSAQVHYALMMFGSIALFYLGIWSGSRTAEIVGLKDPSLVVIDEVAGQFIACAFLPIAPGLGLIAAAFILFRLFDIVKPYPIRQLEKLAGGLGIMADDILAGVYAGVLVYSVNALTKL